MQRNIAWIIVILLVVAGAVYVVAPNTRLDLTALGLQVKREFPVSQGLDLQGGLRVLLEADLPADQTISTESMETARQIVENRVNGLGVSEPVVQRQGDRRIIVELPGIKDPQQAIDTIKQTGLLEFVMVPTGQNLPEDATITTYCPNVTQVDCGNPSQSAPPEPTATTTDTVPGPTFITLMTGTALREAGVAPGQLGGFEVTFELVPEGEQIFSTYTAANIGQILAIVLDKKVISAPRINSTIQGRGSITGSFTQEEANALALQLRYGALPVPLKVQNSLEVGPTLGQDSVRQSTIAGIIGLSAVVLFMILYYRLPGIVAALALGIYAVVTFALFKLIPVTLTLPGIAGFILSVGVAVDANILIFERMKEELRGGRGLRSAVDTGFERAWPSIRDSNISTLITCGILYWFGSTFGASIVKGFAFTLALGVAVSLFTAILVTRTLMHTIMDRVDFSERHSWFGI